MFTRQQFRKFFLFTISAFILVVGPQNSALAQSSVDLALLEALSPFGNFISSLVFYEVELLGAKISLIVVWMGAAMLYLTFYMGFVNVRGFKTAIAIMRGKYNDPTAPGEVTQFQALATAISGTVGIGNIAGVGTALAIGGPGATFWMFVIGLCAMSVKFVECTLGVKYREIHADGSVSGGPMYFLKNGLAARGMKKLGISLALMYGLFGIPTILQWATVNQVYAQVNSVLPMDGWIFGLILATLVGVVIVGGLKGIAQVTSKLVPAMVFIYLSAALLIILMNITAVPAAIGTIVQLAFAPDSVAGGIIGVIIVGMRRAVYSTEAGLGTSSMVHSAAKTNEPVSEGLVGLLEPFIDTVIICTITALVIVLSGLYTDPSLVGISLTSAAFEQSIPFFGYILAIAAFLFGYSTIISWAYYCEKIWEFIFGGSHVSIRIYKTIFILALIPGGVFTPQQVFNIIDSLFFLLAIPNLIGLYILAPEIRADLDDYLARIKAGTVKMAKSP